MIAERQCIGRVIGKYEGQLKGPLLICLGGMHGNEPAGVKAIDLLLKMLEVEPITNPNFIFKGKILGLCGNLRAYQKNKRFINKDLNRQWTTTNIERIKQASIHQLDEEDLEIKELLEIIEEEIANYQPDELIFLDLHTTTAFGGIFSIATDDRLSLKVAIDLKAPVITGMLSGIKGTSLHYFNNDRFEARTTAICFESGQHNENLSVNRAIAAIINCMLSIGCVKDNDVENRHNSLLIEYSKGLPKVAKLLKCHTVKPQDHFQMRPNYKNFQTVKKGELLAYDRNGEIFAIEDSLILMPLYQKQGDDGFFLIRPLDNF